MDGEIDYWEYAFEHDDKSAPKVEYDDDQWVDVDANDLLLAMISFLPQCVWLELYGDPEGVCFAPWLCVCFWLRIRLSRLKELLPQGRGGNDILRGCSVLTRSNGLSRCVVKAPMIFLDRSGVSPSFQPGNTWHPLTANGFMAHLISCIACACTRRRPNSAV